MKLILVAAPLAVLVFVSGCGRKPSAPPPPAGSGLKLQDVSKVHGVDSRKVDAGVLRSREIAGRWNGRLGDADASVTFGPASASFEVLRKDGALVASDSGPMSFDANGRLSGTLTSPSGVLAPFSSWSASFPSPGHLAIAGSGGGMLSVSRIGIRPPKGKPIPAGWHQ